MVRLENKPKHLTKKFYEKYSNCNEILKKEDRPYCVALFEVDGIIFAIPFRTHINHKNCYIFKNSTRSENAGLDFTKAVVIKDDIFIGEEAWVESSEYSEFINKHKVIANRFNKFIKNYKKWVLNPEYYKAQNVIKFSSLKYFYEELGIKNKN